ncbi:hypothetical protein C8Q76DRAFT_798160 [Earliella scabrosa]|nr:hypothetical protein C8Q76DRAFT_798160 [Earliella scabrosa]
MSQPSKHRRFLRAEPTPEAVDRVTELSSELYYAWQERPTVDSSSRPRWNAEFTMACKKLVRVLGNYKFRQLPPFVIGCVWEYNTRSRNNSPFVDADAIEEASDIWHPAFDPDTGRSLHYQPAQDGPVVLRARHELQNVWWDIYTSPPRSQSKPGDFTEDRPAKPDSENAQQTRTPPPVPRTRSSPPVDCTSDAADGASASTAPICHARAHTPLTGSASQASSGTAARKRKRSSSHAVSDGVDGGHPRRGSSAGNAARANEIPENEDVPDHMSFPLGHGCDGCRKADAVCEVDTFAGTVCAHCKKYKIKCSFMQVASKTLRCYLIWRLWKQSSDRQAPAVFLADESASDSAAAPDWWQVLPGSQGSRGRKRAKTTEPRGTYPSKAKSPSPTQHPATSSALRARTDAIAKLSIPRTDSSGAVKSPTEAPHPAPPMASTTASAPRRSERIAAPGLVGAPRVRITPSEPPTTGDANLVESLSRASSGTPSKGSSMSLRVPRLKGSWRDLPTLVRAPGDSASVLPPVSPLLSALKKSRRDRVTEESSAIPVIDRVTEEVSGAVLAIERPPTPPHTAFEPRPATLELVQDAQHAFSEVQNLRQLLEHAADDAAALVKTSRLRAQAALTNVRDATSVSEAVSVVGCRQMQLAIEQQKTSEVLERVCRSLALICAAFWHLPPIPLNNRALTEMLDVLSQLRELYGTAQAKFDLAQEHLQPIRTQLEAVQTEQSAISDCLSHIPNEISTSVYPVLSEFCRNIAEKIREPLIGVISLLRTDRE